MRSDKSTAAIEARGHRLETDAWREALARLGECLGSRAPFLVVTGEAGVGKTWLALEAVERWGARAKPSLVAPGVDSDVELLAGILQGFGLETSARAARAQLRDRLERLISEAEAGGTTPVIVIDDAHELSGEILGELQTLARAAVLAHRPLEVLLVGRPALEERLADPALESLRQQIAVRVRLEPFSQHDTRQFLNDLAARSKGAPQLFSRKVCREIYRHTNGVPRTIVLLAASASGQAHATGATVVGPEHVAAAAAALARTGAVPGRGQVEPAIRADEAVSADRAPEPAVETAVAAPTVAPEPAPAVPVAAPAIVPEPPPAVPVAAQPAAAESAADTEEPAPASDDPRVQDWVSRFIKPGEPRFGELLKAPVPTGNYEHEWTGDDLEEPFAAGEPDAAAVGMAARSPRPGGRRPTLRRSARGGRDRQVISALAVMLVVMTATTLVLLRERKRSAPAQEAVSAVAAEDSARDRARLETAERSSRPKVSRAPKESPARKASQAAKVPADPKATAPSKAGQPAQAESAPAEPAAPVGQFALDVGTFMNRAAAEMHRDRILAETDLKGWVVEDSESATYHVVLGVYSTRGRAELSAGRLLEAGLVSEATVVPLPPRRLRH